ncbi:MAG: hypothetical protein RLP44_00760 [Aggregatilineales bacterium]
MSLLSLVVLAIAPIHAQDDEDDEEDAPPSLAYGEVITGRIDNFTSSAIYSFEALRGDFVAVRLRPTSGNLDPILTILDSTGSPLLTRDDTNGSLEAYEDSLLMTASGRYTVIVARFGYGLGSTIGEYELTVERIGNSSASGSALRYGDTVLNTITNVSPEFFYSFRANEGDIVNIAMQRAAGLLDPKLQIVHIVDGQALVLEESDDTPDSLDARIDELIVPATATYYIVATRYGGEAGLSQGNFILTLQEAANSGLGNTPQTAGRIRLGGQVEGEISNDAVRRYYRFEAQQDDIISVSMTQQSGTLDTYITLTNAGLRPLVEDDDGGIGRNSLIEQYVIPASGTYYIIATRFEEEAGSSSGRFRLELDDLGNAFDGVTSNAQRISYNLTVTGSIDDVTSSGSYVFFGTEGDVVTMTLNRGDGDLDPVLRLLDANQRELVRDDDSGTNRNARIDQYTLPDTGLYYISAERFDGVGELPTTGSYILVLALVSQAEPEPDQTATPSAN